MQDVTIRRAQVEDLPAIVALLADDALGATREDPSIPLNPRYQRAFEAIDKDPNQLLAVVERAGAVTGCMQLSFLPGLRGWARCAGRSRACASPRQSAGPASGR